MLDRHIARCGTPPRQIAADGGYASRDNLDQAKARGVRDVAFHKKRGLAVADMAKSAWVYRRLRNFRAGIEAGISCFKRAYGGGTLHMARPWPFQGLCLVCSGGLQPGAVRTPQTGIAPHPLPQYWNATSPIPPAYRCTLPESPPASCHVSVKCHCATLDQNAPAVFYRAQKHAFMDAH